PSKHKTAFMLICNYENDGGCTRSYLSQDEGHGRDARRESEGVPAKRRRAGDGEEAVRTRLHGASTSHPVQTPGQARADQCRNRRSACLTLTSGSHLRGKATSTTKSLRRGSLP